MLRIGAILLRKAEKLGTELSKVSDLQAPRSWDC